MQPVGGEILTVGHSTRAPGELEDLLRRHRVGLVADVRAHPGSRRMPHFAREALEGSLAAAGISYLHVPELGGRRRPALDSPSSGWRNRQFQGYADHMASDEFRRGLDRVMAAARQALSDPGRPHRICVMCAEAAWWRCHRRLIADALVVRGWRVLHVTGRGQPSPHALTDFAVVDGRRIVYPAGHASSGG